MDRKTVSIFKAMELVAVSRRTIYNWLQLGKVEYVRTAGGRVRIFVDTLFKPADSPPGTRPPTPPFAATPPTEPAPDAPVRLD